jgi:hypothetical protein
LSHGEFNESCVETCIEGRFLSIVEGWFLSTVEGWFLIYSSDEFGVDRHHTFVDE